MLDLYYRLYQLGLFGGIAEARREGHHLCKIKVMDLTQFARKYIWWRHAEASSIEPRRVIAQVMNIGTFEDVMALRGLVGDAELSRALVDALPGEFSERSWHYWHLVPRIAPLHEIPALPVRRFGFTRQIGESDDVRISCHYRCVFAKRFRLGARLRRRASTSSTIPSEAITSKTLSETA